MDFELTEEQKLLKTNAREFMEREIIPIVNDYERKYRPLPQDVSLDLMRKISPLGYTGGMMPPEYGGGGMNFFSYGILLEELSCAWGSLALMTFVNHGMALFLSRLGSDEQKRKYLPRIVSGDLIGCAGLTEPNAGSSNREMETTIVDNGDHYIVNGTKTWITNGGVADLCSLIGYSDKSKGLLGMSQVLVDRTESPFEVRELPKLGFRSCPTAELTFSDCRVPKHNLFIQEGEGYGSIVGSLYVGRCCIGICSVGLAQAAIDDAIKYAASISQRRSFHGVPNKALWFAFTCSYPKEHDLTFRPLDFIWSLLTNF